MSWTLYRWVWQLEAPLAIGMPPAGSLNRCRLYVPARALWGALSATLAQQQQYAAGSQDYRTVGDQIRREIRLTYLYPAEQGDGEWRAWLPRYQEAKGLIWRREDDVNGNSSAADRELRGRLLVTRPSTAIAPASDTAAEGSLRETECLSPYWRDGGSAGRPVGLAGYYWICAESTLRERLAGIDTLFLGGDTRYGLGRIRRIAVMPAAAVFGDMTMLTASAPHVKTDRLLAHGHPPDQAITGQCELLSGWDRTAREGKDLTSLTPKPVWTPGSVTASQAVCWWSIEDNGLWTHTSDLPP
jgi:hypothetical protein